MYTPAFKQELARRYRLLYTPEQLAEQFKTAGVAGLDELIARRHAGTSERALPQAQGLGPIDEWRKMP
jgi:hypothetical protein